MFAVGKKVASLKSGVRTQKEDGNFLYERTNKSLVWDDKMYFFPIPASEMRKNPNLSQNPGW